MNNITTQDGELIDPRPIAEPDCHSWRALSAHRDGVSFAAEMRTVWPDCQWGRFTVVSPEHPNPPYPDGWYFEGWTVDPAKMDPPHRDGPFNYPLTLEPQS